MSKEYTTTGRHRYISIFAIARSLFVIVQLHCDSIDFVTMLQRVLAKAGFVPKCIRFDGTGEYVCKDHLQFLTESSVNYNFSLQFLNIWT